MLRCIPLVCMIALAGFASAVLSPAQSPTGKPATDKPTKVQFARDILPILSSHCFTCHGPDDKGRKAGLRLDLAETATKTLRSGNRAVVPGDTKESALIDRIFAEGEDRMPPPKSNHTLKDSEKNLLKRWIAEGAEYQRHWSFVAPKRPAIPEVKNKTWVRNAVDAFILTRIEK